MESTTYFTILAICAAIILWELSAVSFTNKKIKVKAILPGQKAGIGIFAAVCVAIIVGRWGVDVWQAACMAAIVVAALLNFAIKNGLSEYGVYINGWSTPYKDLKYYEIEPEKQGEMNRVRVSALRKEIVFLFPDDTLELAIAYFEKNETYDMERYLMLKQRQKQELAKNGGVMPKKKKK